MAMLVYRSEKRFGIQIHTLPLHKGGLILTDLLIFLTGWLHSL